MESFRWVTATMTMVLALGMTRLLADAVVLYRGRRRTKMDWVPLVWATCIFYSLLQFSWALQELGPLVEKWTLPLFMMLFGLALILFIAAALVLPHAELRAGEDLRSWFQHDGRSALVFLAGYEAFTNAANWYFWHAAPFTVVGAVNCILAALPIAFLLVSSRKAQSTITLLFAVLDLSMAFVIG
jgi:ABC-type spermidine/putrescine transport system permease subunit I